MNEELEIIKQLKMLGADRIALRSERETIFLSSLKKKLEIHMAQNPVKTGKIENFYYSIKEADAFANFKNIGILKNNFANGAVLAIIILAIGIAGTASASQASLPGDKLYPVKILSEELRSIFTVSPAAKARLETEFSAKRIEEIKKIVQKNGIESKNIDVALDRMQKNTAKAADIINKEKQNGNDVAALEKDIEEKNNAGQNMLNEILKKTEKKTNEPFYENKGGEDKKDTEDPAGEKKEDDVKKDNMKKEKEKEKPDSNPQNVKPKKKNSGITATESPEINFKNRAEKKGDDHDSEDDEDIENND